MCTMIATQSGTIPYHLADFDIFYKYVTQDSILFDFCRRNFTAFHIFLARFIIRVDVTLHLGLESIGCCHIYRRLALWVCRRIDYTCLTPSHSIFSEDTVNQR